MNTKIILVLAFAAVAAADKPSFSYGAPRVASRESFESFESTEAKYDFNWAVNHDDSDNDFGHQEARDNDNTQGSYYVHLPDGRLQKVTYYVDGDSGYVADVSYEGQARYDSVESRESPRPVYSAPRPVYSAPRPRIPDSRESLERPAPIPLRPRHFDSRESLEHHSFESFHSDEDVRRHFG
ncbi:pro-resilin-like [Penaeus japonicus]|uniref:pro-resilin-like n=1 Tax=Penaeus japonicus TaxID=27405 RepID=UPI001C70E57F|nr:pro-resilin-like [Penaeus japonicus]